MEEARQAGLRAPHVVAHTSEDVGFGVPAVLLTFLEASIQLRPEDLPERLQGLARELASVHRHRAEGFPWRHRNGVNRDIMVPPTWSAHL